MTSEYGAAYYLAKYPPDVRSIAVRDLWVSVPFCLRCGAIVHDKTAHDTFHYLFGKL